MPEISGGVLDDELGERVRRRMEEKRHSKEEIQNKLTQIKEPEEEVENWSTILDQKTLYANARMILSRMEIRMQDSYGSTSVLDGYIDTNAPISLLEQEAVKLMEEARALTEDNAIKEAQADVVVQLVERLYTVQEQAFADFEEDMRDGTINHANNASIFDVVNQRRNRGLNLFWMKEENPKKFMETIKQLSDKDIFMVALNMNEGISAFNACYEELLSRIGSGNIFDHIDSIVASREGKNDNIREALLTSAMTTSLMRNKMNDLDKRLGSYIKKEEILSILQQGILENEGLKKWFLLKYEVMKNHPHLQSVLDTVIQRDEGIAQAIQKSEQEQGIYNVDVFSQKQINGLFLFDNEGHGGGKDFFFSNVKKFKDKGFSIENNIDDVMVNKVILKKWNDRLTLVLLKDENYEANIASLGENYNLFALRGHCYNTDQMAYVLGKQNKVEQNDILIDGGCWNANKLGKYTKVGIQGLMFAYTDTGKGASTEHCIDKIFELKAKWASFSDLLSYYKGKKGIDKPVSHADYFANATVMPDNSPYYNYITSKVNLEEIEEWWNEITESMSEPIRSEPEPVW